MKIVKTITAVMLAFFVSLSVPASKPVPAAPVATSTQVQLDSIVEVATVKVAAPITVTPHSLSLPDASVTSKPTVSVSDDNPGGWAMRQFGTAGRELPGEYYILAANSTSTGYSIWEQPAFYAGDRTRVDSIGANIQAHWLAEQLTGEVLEIEDFPLGAIGGGDSAGLAHLIVYLDIATDGDFVGDLKVAATGAIGQFSPASLASVRSTNGKFRAATEVGVDVMFTTAIAVNMTNVVGYKNSGISARETAAEKRHWADYAQWGSETSTNVNGDMAVVHVAHVGDVTSFFCGAGSESACALTDLLSGDVSRLEIPAAVHESAIADALGAEYSLMK